MDERLTEYSRANEPATNPSESSSGTSEDVDDLTDNSTGNDVATSREATNVPDVSAYFEELVTLAATGTASVTNTSDEDSFHTLPDLEDMEEEPEVAEEVLPVQPVILPAGIPEGGVQHIHYDSSNALNAVDQGRADALGDQIPQWFNPPAIAVAPPPSNYNVDIAQVLQDYFDDGDIPSSDDSSSDEDEDSGSTRIITFDQNAPSAHRYLGTDMEDIQGRTLFDEGSLQTLPAHIQSGVVLMPGQTMPMSLSSTADIIMMRTVINTQKTLAILHYIPNSRPNSRRGYGLRRAASIGTTAEVLSVGEDSKNTDSHIRVITRGRQRFKLLGITNQTDGIMSARVKILRETILEDSLEGAIPPSHYKPRVKYVPSAITDMDTETDGSTSNNQRKRKHNQCCYFTPWPGWVHSQYSPTVLMNRLKEEIRQWGDRTYGIMNRITCPDQLAYWLADNIPMSDNHKLQILALQSSIQRLRYELHLIQKYKSLSCRNCNTLIARRSDVFSLSIEGPMGTFVNPHGCVHETLTLSKAKHLSLDGRPQTEFSWYPGYAWTIANCRTCGSHKGWRFTSTTLQPPLFYGLARKGLSLGVHPDPNNSDEVQEHLDPADDGPIVI